MDKKKLKKRFEEELKVIDKHWGITKEHKKMNTPKGKKFMISGAAAFLFMLLIFPAAETNNGALVIISFVGMFVCFAVALMYYKHAFGEPLGHPLLPTIIRTPIAMINYIGFGAIAIILGSLALITSPKYGVKNAVFGIFLILFGILLVKYGIPKKKKKK